MATTATTIEGAIAGLIASKPAVIAILGPGAVAANKIRPFTNTIGKDRPYITYFRLTTDRPISNEGPTGQGILELQLDLWTDDMMTARRLASAIRSIHGYRGVFSGQKIDSIRVSNETDATNTPAAPGQAVPVQRVTLDLTISHAESLA